MNLQDRLSGFYFPHFWLFIRGVVIVAFVEPITLVLEEVRDPSSSWAVHSLNSMGFLDVLAFILLYFPYLSPSRISLYSCSLGICLVPVYSLLEGEARGAVVYLAVTNMLYVTPVALFDNYRREMSKIPLLAPLVLKSFTVLVDYPLSSLLSFFIGLSAMNYEAIFGLASNMAMAYSFFLCLFIIPKSLRDSLAEGGAFRLLDLSFYALSLGCVCAFPFQIYSLTLGFLCLVLLRKIFRAILKGTLSNEFLLTLFFVCDTTLFWGCNANFEAILQGRMGRKVLSGNTFVRPQFFGSLVGLGSLFYTAAFLWGASPQISWRSRFFLHTVLGGLLHLALIPFVVYGSFHHLPLVLFILGFSNSFFSRDEEYGVLRISKKEDYLENYIFNQLGVDLITDMASLYLLEGSALVTLNESLLSGVYLQYLLVVILISIAAYPLFLLALRLGAMAGEEG